MRPGTLILVLATLSIVLGLVVSSDPEGAQRLSRLRDAALTGAARESAILLLAAGLAAFIGYLTLTRR